MAWIIITVILAILGLVAVGYAMFGSMSDDKTIGIVAAAIVFVVWIIISVAMSIKTVGAGEVGIVRQFGEIVGQEGEGVSFVAPWQSVDTVSIRTQRVTFENLEAASADTQDVFVTVTINYSVSESAVQDLFRDFGSNWYDVLVPSRVRNHAKAVLAQYETIDIIPQRDAIRTAIMDPLVSDLDRYSITVSDLLLDNISFSQEYMDAIEQRQVATEQARRQQELLAVTEAEADQRRESAQGEADALEIDAAAQAEANRLITASLTPELLQWQAIQRLADDVQIMLLPSGQGMLIDPSTMLAPTTTAP
jgi:regulator of protease activity HflC (stomatin/prohibitin superfamily)